ncbi:MAG: GNAT family N-acetyltransferase [Candidatus Paceibacterota bacterium]
MAVDFDIIIADAVVGDEVEFARIYSKVWPEIYANRDIGVNKGDIDMEFESIRAGMLDNWRVIIENNGTGDGYCCVAKNGGAVVGMCGAVREKINNRIRDFYIIADYRAKGVGKKLFDRAINWFGNDLPILMDVVAYNKKVISIFENHGFLRTNKPLRYREIAGNKKVSIIEFCFDRNGLGGY